MLIFFCFFSLLQQTIYAQEKIKIGLLVPLTGDDKKIGEQIIKSIRIALNDINTDKIEIYLKDTKSDPKTTLRSAIELRELGIKIIIGPIFLQKLRIFR